MHNIFGASYGQTFHEMYAAAGLRTFLKARAMCVGWHPHLPFSSALSDNFRTREHMEAHTQTHTHTHTHTCMHTRAHTHTPLRTRPPPHPFTRRPCDDVTPTQVRGLAAVPHDILLRLVRLQKLPPRSRQLGVRWLGLGARSQTSARPF
jgi:hypothetical protein